MKKILYYILFILMLIPVGAGAMELPKLYSDKVLLYDPESQEILYEEKSEEVTSIASLTKIMTTIVAIENIKNLDEQVKITWNMLSEVPYDASVAGLKVGDKVTYRDLLYASILPSGADATTALAHSISGTTDKFIVLMNKKASELGLKHTHFSNVTGYDIDNHYSTAKEVLQILLYSLKNPLFKEIYETRTYTLSNGLKVESTVNRYNRTLKLDLSKIIGSKTGYTGDAGLCMSAIIRTNNKDLILITLGAEYSRTNPYNLVDTLNIIEYLDDNYNTKVLYKKDEELFKIPVKNSKVDEYIVKVKDNIEKYVEVNYDTSDLKYEYDGLNELSYKNKEGEKIGHINYYYKNKLFYDEDIYLVEELKFSFYKYFMSHIVEFSSLFLIGVIMIILIKSKCKRRKRVLSKS